MVQYECFRCGYIASQRCNMKQHLHRKNICNPKDDDMEIDEIKKYYGFEIETENDTQTTPKQHPNDTFCKNEGAPKMHPNDTQTTPKQHPNDTQTTPKLCTRVCKYCNKSFTRKSGLLKHLNICKNKIEAETLVINQNEEIIKMKKEIEKLKSFKIQTQNNTTNNNNSHNITNNNNTIIINNYGEENIEHLSKKYLLNLFSRTYKAIPLLVEKIHFDPEHPENQNIKLTNKKLPYIKIKKNDKWQFVDRKTEIIDLIDAMCFILSENYQNMNLKGENNLNQRQKNVIDKYLEKYRNDDKKLMKELENIVDLTLINNSL